MNGRKLLIVDDEPAIVQTLSVILSQHGFDVATAGDVATALQAISSTRFDVLVTDLNIGQPGDGFTVVSALRRTQPDAIALIITGFPAFDKALQAIREQVDDFLVKPIHPTELVQAIERMVRSRPVHVPLATKRISDVVREQRDAIIRDWLNQIKAIADKEHGTHLRDDEMRNHFPALLDELCSRVDDHSDRTSANAVRLAETHGRTRRSQGFTPSFLLRESNAIRRQILTVIHTNLMSLNLSYLFSDLTRLSNSLDEQLEMSMESFLAEQPQHAQRSSSE